VGVIALDCDDDFSTWRSQARTLLGHGIDPSDVTWAQGPMADLLAVPAALPQGPGPFQTRVPAGLLGQLEQASRYQGEQRWNLLYEVLWRVAHGDRTAMLAGDRLGSALQRRIKQVSREAHHLHAFVRFIPCNWTWWLSTSRPTTSLKARAGILPSDWADNAG
jgi:probable DNA metabolism protein